MLEEEITARVRHLRTHPIWDDDPPATDAGISAATFLPHRAPFLFVDSIKQIDYERLRLRASRSIAADDPVFIGHFPNDPVYPGGLLVETLAQTAACLAALVIRHDEDTATDEPRPVRLTRIRHALFLHAVGPRDTLDLQVSMAERDTIISSFSGQAWVDGTQCCLILGEFVYVD